MAKLTHSLVTPVLICLGFILMATPLALWVAWTDIILLGVLLTGISAAVLYCFLVRFEKPGDVKRHSSTRQQSTGKIPQDILEELQDLHPFIHHHSAGGKRRFRAAMSRLRRFLYG